MKYSMLSYDKEQCLLWKLWLFGRYSVTYHILIKGCSTFINIIYNGLIWILSNGLQ